MSKKANRYPGVIPFTADQKDVFFGRKNDQTKLLRLLKSEQQVLLYAKSGTGKSSLVNAGVLPVLREENKIKDIRIRFGAYKEEQEESPADICRKSLPAASDFFLNAHIETPPSLWQHFKALQNQGDTEYLLVFDQFEELFSYPEEQITDFKKQLSDVLHRDVPRPINEQIEKKEKETPGFLTDEQYDLIYERPEVKILMVIREDRYSLMNQLTDYLPYCLQNRYTLAPLDRTQAAQAISEPARAEGAFASDVFSYKAEALEKILDFLTKNNTRGVETTQLQILCNRLESLRIPEIKVENIPSFEDIFREFYQESLSKVADKERTQAAVFIETELIKKEQRISLDELVCRDAVSAETMEKLVNSHLLRAERNHMGAIAYELAHDTLVGPILKAKDERETEELRREEEDRQAKELRVAKEKAEKDRIEKEKTAKQLRTVRTLLIAAVIALLVAAGAGWTAYQAKNEAEEQKELAVQAKNEADTEKQKAQKALTDFLKIQAAKQHQEFKALKVRAQRIIDGGSCSDDIIDKMQSIAKEYPDSLSYKAALKEFGSLKCN